MTTSIDAVVHVIVDSGLESVTATISGPVTLAAGTSLSITGPVGLAAGTSVGLVSGTSVTLADELNLATQTRWGILREPAWVDGAEITTPTAGGTLVTKTVTAGKQGRVFGVNITAEESNRFQLVAGAQVFKDFALSAEGTIFIALQTPLANNLGGGSLVAVKNVNAAAATKVYQASILYDEN